MSSQDQLILKLQEELERVKTGADIAWVNSCGYIIFFMQTGFCLLEAGAVRHKNHMHTILLQVLNALASVFGWWIFGFAFAYGNDNGKGFIGSKYFAGHELLKDAHKMADWIFDMGSAATAAKIVSGAILERVIPGTYFIYGIFMTAWIYPLAVHWAWHPQGWLKQLGYIDHAGSGVVHMTGGAAALAACLVIGPRLFRFSKKSETEAEIEKRIRYNHKNFDGNFVPFSAIGTLLLWYCWYGFNCGSSHAAVSTDESDNSSLIGIVGINTSIATSAGGMTLFAIVYIKSIIVKDIQIKYDVGLVCNGLLAGAVAVTAGCGTIYPYAAFIIGVMAGIIYYAYELLIFKLKIDDPLHAGPIHLGTGSFGVAAVGIFHKEKGFLYGGGGKLFGVQLLGVVCYFAWSFFHTLVFFLLMKLCKWDRVSEEEEIAGCDVTSCGGSMVFNYDEESLKYYNEKSRKDLINSSSYIMTSVNQISDPVKLDSDKELNAAKN